MWCSTQAPELADRCAAIAVARVPSSEIALLAVQWINESVAACRDSAPAFCSDANAGVTAGQEAVLPVRRGAAAGHEAKALARAVVAGSGPAIAIDQTGLSRRARETHRAAAVDVSFLAVPDAVRAARALPRHARASAVNQPVGALALAKTTGRAARAFIAVGATARAAVRANVETPGSTRQGERQGCNADGASQRCPDIN